MLSEWLMHLAGFDAIWYAHPGNYHPGWSGCWFSGIWSGPQNDLVCVRRCATNLAANGSLSPGAHTILGAVTKSILVRRYPWLGPVFRGEKCEHCQGGKT